MTCPWPNRADGNAGELPTHEMLQCIDVKRKTLICSSIQRVSKHSGLIRTCLHLLCPLEIFSLSSRSTCCDQTTFESRESLAFVKPVWWCFSDADKARCFFGRPCFQETFWSKILVRKNLPLTGQTLIFLGSSNLEASEHPEFFSIPALSYSANFFEVQFLW